jgi:hypothetical protein
VRLQQSHVGILATGYSSRTSRWSAVQEPAGARYALLVPVYLQQRKSLQAVQPDWGLVALMSNLRLKSSKRVA